MFYSSLEWKRELGKQKVRIIKNNILAPSHKVLSVSRCHNIDAGILLSAVIIRKLGEFGKLTDNATKYDIPVFTYDPIRNIDKMHRYVEEGDYNWTSGKIHNILGKTLCNSIIHSFAYCLCIDEFGLVDSFFVSSDFDRNRTLHKVGITQWIEYIDVISSDDITSERMIFDNDRKDYIFDYKR